MENCGDNEILSEYDDFIDVKNKGILQQMLDDSEKKINNENNILKQNKINKNNNNISIKSELETVSISELKKRTKKLKKKKAILIHKERERKREDIYKRTKQYIKLKKEKQESLFIDKLKEIDTTNGIYYEVNKYLNEYNNLDFEKKKKLHNEWMLNIFEPINDRINNILNNNEYQTEKKEILRNLYQNYLLQTNNKNKPIFLDSFDENVYDPFKINKNTENININDLKYKDPIKSDLVKILNEQKIEKKIIKFSLKPKLRKCISPKKYNSLKHLPIFRDIKILNDIKNKCILPSHKPGGNILLNQYNIQNKIDNNIIKQETFKQSKRRVQPSFQKYEFKISQMW